MLIRLISFCGEGGREEGGRGRERERSKEGEGTRGREDTESEGGEGVITMKKGTQTLKHTHT